MSESYSAKDIEILEGLEAVRLRPGMYIGSTGKTGLHHLLWEILDNSVDEAMNGYARTIRVTLHEDGCSLTVADDGRGIPVDIQPKLGIPAVTVVYTVVQAAGDLVAAAAELAAGVEHGEHHLQRGAARLGLNVHGNAASVIADGDGVAVVDGHMNIGTKARQRLVDGVVHDLIDQMVQAAGTGRADIHTGPLTHGLQPLQHLYFRRILGRT